jgi:Ca2+-binding EF-hand superfamily protein
MVRLTFQTTTSMIRLFSKFVQSHQTQLGTSFHQFDRDRTGILGIDEVKTALKDAGLRLTNVSRITNSEYTVYV